MFLYEEMQTRFAQSLQELRSLPHGLSDHRGVRKTIRRYEEILRSLEESEVPSTDIDERDFVDVLRSAMCEDGDTICNLIDSLVDVRDDFGSAYHKVQPEVDAALERFLQLQIGQRFLVNHYIEPVFSRSGRIGVFQLQCRLGQAARNAAEQTIHLCKAQYGKAPRIIVHDEDPQRFMASSAHVSYILTEIFKNSLRAVVEHNGVERHPAGEPLPPIHCEIVSEDGEATLKISDLGGGIAQTRMDDIWKYSFTTSSCAQTKRQRGDRSRCVMAGYGIGLPMSRLYARYFGGDLEISSVEGVGSDVHLRLSARGFERENLPRQDLRTIFPVAPFSLPTWISKESWQLNTLLNRLQA